MKRRRGHAAGAAGGFTLIEVLAALALSGVVFASLFGLLIANVRGINHAAHVGDGRELRAQLDRRRRTVGGDEGGDRDGHLAGPAQPHGAAPDGRRAVGPCAEHGPASRSSRCSPRCCC
ncbi:MAG: prepilin-type N-terminal cleavage/methylation domain-containing protein [Chloroflexi bacterium]|nr:MAG: prepilin-type N-terminal cleavage/methylation domain-containing protein [Chloroflexota bacterium]